MSELEEQFLRSPIARWTAQFYTGHKALSFSSFCDAYFLYNNIWLQIDPDASELPTPRIANVPSEDHCTRLKNLQVLLNAILSFYRNSLDQVLVLRLPDILALARYESLCKPDVTRHAISEMTGLLLLLLGCAVQCEKKQDFVVSIKTLDVETQHSLMESIQQIADNPESVWTRDGSPPTTISANTSTLSGVTTALSANVSSSDEQTQTMYNTLVDNVKRLTDERDQLAGQCIQLTLDKLNLQKAADSSQPPPSPVVRTHQDNSGLALELADAKSKLRRLQHEYEEKIEILSETREECDQLKDNMQRLRQENLELLQESRGAKAFRDEIDILKERCLRYETLEKNLQRYKDKMNDMDFLRSRCEELKEDLRVTTETKHMLEDKLESSRKKVESLVNLESELISLKVELSEIHLERDLTAERLNRLAEENSQLHVDKKNLIEEIKRLQLDLSHSIDNEKEECDNVLDEGTSLLEQMHNDIQSRCKQLELEREQISSQLQDAEKDKEKLQQDIVNLNLQVNQLSRRLEMAQSDCKQLSTKEAQLNTANLEKMKLVRAKENLEKRLEESQTELIALRNENSRLTASLKTLKCVMQKTNQLETEKTDLEFSLKTMEQEKKSCEKELLRCKLSLEQREKEVDDLSEQLAEVERIKDKLEQELKEQEQFKLTIAKNEMDIKDLEEKLLLEKAALVDLRREMVSEKVKNGMLENELEQIHIQLDNMERQHREQQQQANEMFEVENESMDNNAKNKLNVAIGKSSASSTTDEYITTAESLIQSTSSLNEEETEIVVNENSDEQQTDCEMSVNANEEAVNEEIGDINKNIVNVTDNSKQNTDQPIVTSRVSDLKEKIVLLEQKKLSSEQESRQFKKQLSITKQQLLNAEFEISQEVAKREALMKQNAALQAHFARLEVDQSVAISAKQQLQEQTELLKTQLSEVKNSLREKDLENARICEKMENVAKDYQVLEGLHKQLSCDFEELKQTQLESKNTIKAQKNQIADLKKHIADLKQEIEELTERIELQQNMDSLASIPNTTQSENANGSLGLGFTSSEPQLNSLLSENTRLRDDFNSLNLNYKSLKSAHNELSVNVTQLQCQLQETQDEKALNEVELNRLTSSYQMLQHINQVLEDERKSLLVKVTSLMASYDQHFGRLLDAISTCESGSSGQSRYELDRLKMEEERRLLEDKISEYTSKLDNGILFQKAISSRSSTPLLGGTPMGNRERDSSLLQNQSAPLPALQQYPSSSAYQSPLQQQQQQVKPSEEEGDRSGGGGKQPSVYHNKTFENQTTVNVINQISHQHNHHHHHVHEYPQQPQESITTFTTNLHHQQNCSPHSHNTSQYMPQLSNNTMNLSSLNHGQPSATSTPVPYLSRMTNARHSMYSKRSDISNDYAAGGGSQHLFRTTLKSRSQTMGHSHTHYSDNEANSHSAASSRTSIPALIHHNITSSAGGQNTNAVQTASPVSGAATGATTANGKTKQDVWYEYGCV